MEEKNLAPFRQSSVSSIRAEDKRLFRDAIQLAIIDAKTPTTVFFLTSTTGDMTKDFQRLDDTFIKHFLNLFMNDASFSRRDSVGSLVDWSMITSKNPVFSHSSSRLSTCRSS
ncbi:hypothetical protein TNCV_42291 [Trichonephila clavipes]|nr:hypothetical protein TNCV_42291 [Trichonephila clavipes]